MKAVLVVALAHLVFAAIAVAGPPAGPRLATVELIKTEASQRSEDEGPPLMALASVDPSTGKDRRFLRSPLEVSGRVTPSPFYGPAWSVDGGLVAFSGHVGESGRGKIFVLAAGGGGLRALPRTENGTNPVFSPDGHTLAFARTRTRIHIDLEHVTEPGKSRSRFYSSTTTWVVDLGGGKPRRLTRWRNGLSNVPTSFTADGSGLLVTKEDSHLDGPWIVRLGLADGGPEEIVQGATEGVLSPDGTRIAFVGYLHPDLVEAEENNDYLASDLYVMPAEGGPVRRLTRTRGVIESSPSWDPSGQRLGYVQVKADTSFVAGLALLFPTGNSLMQMNADGSCKKKIASDPKVAFYGVAWQPGPGREAAPISC